MKRWSKDLIEEYLGQSLEETLKENGDKGLLEEFESLCCSGEDKKADKDEGVLDSYVSNKVKRAPLHTRRYWNNKNESNTTRIYRIG